MSIKTHIENLRWWAFYCDRTSMAKGITSRGTIDSGYTGSIKAVLFNHGPEGYLIKTGDKITQLVLLPIITPELEIVEELETTDRAANGFGSTGR